MSTNLTSRKNNFRFFLLLVLSGLVLRGLYLFEYAHFVNFDLAIGADVGEYYSRAQEILKGIIFPAQPEIHAPLYSFFLAVLKKIGLELPGIRIIQTLLNFFSWIGLYFLLLKKGFPEKFCLFFAGISMVLAPLIFHPAELISESLLLPLFTCVFFCFHFGETDKSPEKFLFPALAGIFSGLAFLTHGMVSGFLLLETFYLFVRKKRNTALFFLAGILLVILPFLTVKSVYYGKLTGVQANTGFNIFLGNNPRATGKCYMRPGDQWRKTHFQAQEKAAARGISTDRYFLEQALDFWKKTPGKGVLLYLKKCILIFSGNEYIAGADGGFLFCRTEVMNWLRIITWPVILLAFFGIYQLFRQKEFLWTPPLILALALFLMQLLTVTSGRYRLLMFPGMVFLAALGAYSLEWKKYIFLFLLLCLLSGGMNYGFMGHDKVEGTALLGQAHFLKGNYEHAEELLLSAEKRFKDASRINNMLGNIAEKRGDLALAGKHYSYVAKREPYMPEGWMNLANVTPDPALADRYFRSALKAASPSPGADLTYNYAKFLFAVKRVPEAEKMLAQTFRTDPEYVLAWNLSGLIAAGKQDFKLAAERFYHAARLKPDEPGYWKNTAITARMAGDSSLEHLAAENYNRLTRKK